MCGISGTAGFADRDLLERMTSLIVHRGPDDGGTYVSKDGQIGLGNRRLSIIDLSAAGHMPMSNEDGSVWITYNGEIYNFQELRRELVGKGHEFRSHTDTEVLVHGYEEWGDALPCRLNGMFAFAILDQRGTWPTLFLARDRMGIKPLYYSCLGGRLVFGSEIKSLLECEDVPRRLSREALHRYLSFLWVPGPGTMFEGISKLPPGHSMTWHRGEVSIRQYWDLRFNPDDRLTIEDACAELRDVLRRSVARQMVSDVPLGLFLSGGLDSSTLLALATEAVQRPLSVYTIAYDRKAGELEQSPEDAHYARIVARQFGANYHEITLEPAMIDLLPKVVWHMDEPVADAASISTYLICEAARPELTVLLSGQGSDEIFAGYRVHRMHRMAGIARAIPAPLRNGPAQWLLNVLPIIKGRLPGVHPGLLLAAHRHLRRLLEGAALPAEERFVFYRAFASDADSFNLYSSELQDELAGVIAGQRHLDYFAAHAHSDFLHRMLYVDAKTFLPELNLTYGDKLSAASSVEVRVPFLDNEVVDFAAKVPAHLSLSGFTLKNVLKRSMRGILSDSVIYRRKAGFGAPTRHWLRNDMRPMVDDLLSETAVRRRGLFDARAIRRLIDEDRRGVHDHSNRIWALLVLELWHETFLASGSRSVAASVMAQ